MYKKIIIYTLSLIISFLFTSELISIYNKPKVYTIKELYKEKANTVVEIISIPNSKEPQVHGGTGFFISEYGKIITAAHVIYDSDTGICKTILVLDNDQDFYLTRVLKVDLQHDIAILQLTQQLVRVDSFTNLETKNSKVITKKFNFLRIHPSHKLVAGDEISTIGYPGVFFRIIDNGIVSSSTAQNVPQKDENLIYKDVVTTTLFVQPGNSGGPILDKYGYVVGVLTLSLKNSSMSFFQRSEYINRLLHTNSKKIIAYKPTRYYD